MEAGDAHTSYVPFFWFVRASWSGLDQTARFLSEGIGENDYPDEYFLKKVRQMRAGERIAITKYRPAQKTDKGLPFDSARLKQDVISVMPIIAVGTIKANPGDGRRVEVEWQPQFDPPREWYFYVYFKQPIWGLRRSGRNKVFNDLLVDFTFNGAEQDYSWFLSHWSNLADDQENTGDVVSEQEEKPEQNAADRSAEVAKYGLDEMLEEGVFLPRSDLEDLIQLVRTQKNVILQGPPGVGKTFLAKKLAYALIGCRDEARITRIQFHQSTSYEDFVRGLRPTPNRQGFSVEDGIFLKVAEAARKPPAAQDYVLIVEEINRGNPDAIFGELLTLLEPDKRDRDSAIRLILQKSPDEPNFYVPPNMYVIGTMNLADRSLANLDYALRRRFAFESLRPNFGDLYTAWCKRQGLLPASLATEIARRVNRLNEVIDKDPTLGPDFMIGHSFFCPRPTDLENGKPEKWFRKVVAKQIIPLLEQYWFDNLEQVQRMRALLVEGIN